MSARSLLPAVGVGVAVGLVGFYFARLFLERTPLVSEGNPGRATNAGRRRSPAARTLGG